MSFEGEKLLGELLARPPRSFHGLRAYWQSRERAEEYLIDLDHEKQRWSVRNLTTGVDSSFRDGKVMVGTEVVPAASYRSMITAPPLQLLLPEHLPVWGRRGRDSHAPRSREMIDDRYELITLESVRDPMLRTYLVIDRILRLPVRFQESLTVTLLNPPTGDQ